MLYLSLEAREVEEYCHKDHKITEIASNMNACTAGKLLERMWNTCNVGAFWKSNLQLKWPLI